MSLKEAILGQLAQAIKAKDVIGLNTLRLLKTAIRNKEADSVKKHLTG